MKKVIFSLLLLSVCALGGYAQNQPVNATPADNPNAGDFAFSEETYDFGKIPKGTPVTHEFAFSNTGKEPIVISNVQASCGCTATNYEKNPIAPGQTTRIVATFNAAVKGAFKKTVTVTTSAEETPRTLIFMGTVI